MKLYVGNLPYSLSEDALRAEFSEYGGVDEVAMITDRETGRPRGFAFVTMNDADEAKAAIAGLDGTELGGRTMNVNEAKPKGGGR